LDVRCLMFDFGYPMPEAGHRVLDNGWRIGGCVGGQTLPVAPVRMAGKRVICPWASSRFAGSGSEVQAWFRSRSRFIPTGGGATPLGPCGCDHSTSFPVSWP